MYRSIILLSLATLGLAASNGDLKITLSTLSNIVASVDDILITAIISNPTEADIKVIGRNNVFDTRPTSSFKVTDANDASVFFTGARTTIDPSNPDVYVTILAGQSIAVNHTDLAGLYDFQSHGTGSFTFAPNSVFQTSATDLPFYADYNTIAITVTSDVAKRDIFELEKQKRSALTSTPVCSDSSRQTIIANALADGRARAGGAATDILSHPSGPEFTTYFGGNSDSTLWYNFDRIAGDLDSESGVRNIYCAEDTDPANLCPSGGDIAYTLLVYSNGAIISSNIYLCDYFFTSTGQTSSICSTRSYDATNVSQGGVILHELSHATAGTQDITYGCSACAALSSSDKLNNADNYRCMGLDIYLDYNC